jgi:hypothetical protein
MENLTKIVMGDANDQSEKVLCSRLWNLMLIQLLGDLGHRVDMQVEMRVWGLEILRRVRLDPATEE